MRTFSGMQPPCLAFEGYQASWRPAAAHPEAANAQIDLNGTQHRIE